MSQSNPILALAERVHRDQLSPEQAHQAVLQLIDQGLSVRDLEEALDSLNDSDVSSSNIALIGEICIDVRWYTREEDREDRILTKLAQLESKPITSMRAILNLCERLLPHLDADSQEYGRILLSQGQVIAGLAGYEFNLTAKSPHAIELFQQASGLLIPSSPEHGRALMAEGHILNSLALLGVDVDDNMERAAKLYERTRSCFDPQSLDYCLALLGEGGVRYALAHSGIEPSIHVQRAAELFQLYHDISSPDDAIAVAYAGLAYLSMGQRGIDTVSNLQQALALLDKSCGLMTSKDRDYGVVLLHKGYVHLTLVNMGIEMEEQRNLAIEQFEKARQYLAAKSWEEGQALINEGLMRHFRGMQKLDPNDVHRAVDLQVRARLCVEPDSLFYCFALGAEADSCMALVQFLNARKEQEHVWNDPLVYLKRATDLCDEALHLAEVAGGMVYRLAVRRKGQALTLLAQFGQDREANGREAQVLLSQALRHLHPESKEYGQDLCFLANLLFQLSNVDDNWEANANRGMDLFEQAAGCLSWGTPDYDLLFVLAITATSGWIQRGFEPETAVPRLMKWVQQASNHLIPGSMYYGMLLYSLAGAGMALWFVGQNGIETDSNFDRAETLLNLFLKYDICCPGDGQSLLKHGTVRSALSDLGIDPVSNSWQAIDLFQQARKYLDEQSQDYVQTLIHEGQARMHLAGPLGRWSEDDLNETIELYRQARERLQPHSQTLSQVLYAEAIARKHLANVLWIKPVENLEIARDLCKQVIRDDGPFASSSRDYALAQTSLASTLIHLAKLDIDRESNTREAKKLLNAFLQAPRGSKVLSDAAQAYLDLADLSGNTRSEIEVYLQNAMDLCDRAKELLTPHSSGYGQILLKKALVLQKWPAADKDENPGMREAIEVIERKRLEEATEACREARKCFDFQSIMYTQALLGEASRLWYLALYGASWEIVTRQRDLSAESEEQMRYAVDLMSQVIERSDIDEFDTTQTRLIRAHGLWLLRESELAYRCMKEGLETAEKTRGRMESRYERNQFLAATSMIYFYQLMVRICLGLFDQASTAPEREGWLLEAWHWVHRCKSRDLREQLSQDNGLSADTQPVGENWKSWSWDLDRLEAQIQRLREKKRGDGLRASKSAKIRREPSHKKRETAEIERLESDRTRLLQNWKDACKPILQSTIDKAWGAGMTPPPHKILQELRALANMGYGSNEKPLLVEFVLLSDYEWGVFLVPLWHRDPSEPSIFVYYHNVTADDNGINTSDMAITMLKATLGLRADWIWHEEDLGPKAEAEAPQVLMERLMLEMGARLIEPWGHYLKDWKPTELILAPHGMFNVLPLHAAIWKNDKGEDEPLIASYSIAYLPSAALASEIQKRRKPLKAGNALLVGDPIGDLQSARDEIRWIEPALLAHNFSPRRLVGRKATTDTVFVSADQATILHLATHSVYKGDFLRSGFALADRRMTIMDMLVRLKLPNAVLAYLGSCDSGYQGVDTWNELMALVRVFLQAGSPTVVASLWPVRDAAASAFAVHFYKFWLIEGLSPGRAFQRATLATRKDHKDVLDWAPFTLMGSWNNLIEETHRDHP